ncbi:zinc finger protein 511-like [Biomphalaria glabrata]|uniref:Zinc finger protein 511-like n=1 Tax=Biomphalaria glabrata TaxID=6526 RepID=A0A9W2YX72_BIOGL|nr:zinc finger protein 511-like [Biomphalaria glabrata]
MDEPCENVLSELNLKATLAQLDITPQLMEYYLSLRRTLTQHRDEGVIIWCDPRDPVMVARLAETHWKPSIMLKLPDSVGEDHLGFTSKQTALEDDVAGDKNIKDESLKKISRDNEAFVCGVHGCNAMFSSIANYESHYSTNHIFRCSACKRIFVSNFLLDVHIEENHDSYFKALSSRIPMYRCLVENCTQKFQCDADRQSHLVEQHKFPHKFSFHKPIKSKPQQLESKDLTEVDHDILVSSPTESLMQTEDISKPEAEKNFSSTTAKSQRVPSAICFGRGSKRAFKNRSKKHQDYQWYHAGKMDVDTTVNIENIDFKDLSDSIPNIA